MCSLQLGVFGFGLLEDGYIRVGVLPKREKILIGRLGPGRVALQGAGAAKAEMHERAHGQPFEAAVIERVRARKAEAA